MDTRCLPAKVAGPTSALKVYPVRRVPSVAAVPMCQQEEWALAFDALCYAQVQTFLFSCDVHRCWGLAVTLINDGPGTAFRMPSIRAACGLCHRRFDHALTLMQGCEVQMDNSLRWIDECD